MHKVIEAEERWQNADIPYLWQKKLKNQEMSE